MSDSNAYYRRRAEEELAAARMAADPGIAQIHREMARRYRGLLNDEPSTWLIGERLAQTAGGQLADAGTVCG